MADDHMRFGTDRTSKEWTCDGCKTTYERAVREPSGEVAGGGAKSLGDLDKGIGRVLFCCSPPCFAKCLELSREQSSN